MELSPQSVASTTFKTVKKGYDPDEVRAYLARLATAIESTQSQATAMEARARAAVARLQEMAANTTPASQPAAEPVSSSSAGDEAGTISRTLLLAQRTADSTVAEAEAEAELIREQARELQSRMIEEAKSEARGAAEAERIQVESEVQALLARREFLLSDVDHLEQHVITHRDRLREVAGALTAIVERGPGGLADVRRPLMSAVTDEDAGVESSTDADPVDAARVDATQPMSRLDWLPAETGDNSTGDNSSDDASDDELANELANEVATEPAAQQTVDVTPPAGVPGLFDEVSGEVTGELPVVSRPAKDAFGGRGDDRR